MRCMRAGDGIRISGSGIAWGRPMSKPGTSFRRPDATRRSRRNTSRGNAHRSRPTWDYLEDRTLLTPPTLTIVDATVQEGSGAGPTVLSGSISPGSAIVGYRIDGVAGERLRFHSDAFSSTAGIWDLYGPG